MVKNKLIQTMEFLVLVLIILVICQIVLTGAAQEIVSILSVVYTLFLGFLIFYRVLRHEL
jgi:hypothetical protein